MKKNVRSSGPKVFCEKSFLKISQNSQKKNCFFNKAFGSKQLEPSKISCISMFPVMIGTCGGERYIYVFVTFCPCWNKKFDCKQMKGEEKKTYCRSVNKSELLICVPISCGWANFFWIAFAVLILKLLNSHTVIFRQYKKKYCILHIVFISSAANSKKCSVQNFLEYAF